jgi:Domain of unknown function (DUF4168)
MSFRNPLIASLVAAAFAAPLAAPVLAQEAAGEQSAAPASFSEEKLRSFVTAALQVTEIQQSYQATIAEAETPEAQQELVAQANTEMAEAIETTPGITIEEYVAIGEAAQADPALGDRISAIAAEQQAE